MQAHPGGWALALALWLLAPEDQAPGAVSFQNEVMAVLSRGGCNAGVCHGNRNGKGGLKLSLRGDDPEGDFLTLTRELYGRRLDRIDPGRSLLLLKPTAQVSHQGGLRFTLRSEEYRILHGWIAEGLRRDPRGAPRLERIEVSPPERVLFVPEDEVRLETRAFFSDGSTRDIRGLAVYEASSPLASVDSGGRARLEGTGEVTVLVRYLHCQAPVRLARVPARPDFVWRDPPVRNYIDRHVFSRLRELRLLPSEPAGDGVFQRRAFLDLLGLLPTAAEARAFAADRSAGKRPRLVESLLARPEFADFWALKWSDLLRNEEKSLDRKGVRLFHDWIRVAISERMPLDRFVRELVAGRGSTYQNPPANYYRAHRDPLTRAEAAAQVFLGTRLGCARCHNHPFDRWTQEDYYGWAGFFSRVKYKVLENRRRDQNDHHEFIGEQVVFMDREGEVDDPRTGRPAPPRFLGAGAFAGGEDRDRLEELAAWLTAPENPLFARAQANRIWYHLMGRGLVEPVDDFRATNPPLDPQLLDALAGDLVKHGFDLRHLLRTIMASETYGLSSEPNETNRDDQTGFSRALVRRLSAEQLLDAQHQVVGAPGRFNGYPLGFRAGQIPGVEAVRARDGQPATGDDFLKLFGKPVRLLTCECERSSDATLGQAFHLLSGPGLNELLTHPQNRLARLLLAGHPDREAVEELYWAALTRSPAAREVEAALEHLERSGDRRAALEDLTWGLLNSKEFILRQ